MIGDRNSRGPKPNLPRMIVKRQKEVVGAHRERAIVTRPRGVVEARRASTPAPSRGFRIGIPRRVLVVAAAVGVLAAMVGGGVYTYESPLFRVAEVRVDGTSRIDSADVIAAAALQDESMFTANLGEAQHAIATGLPLVKSVKLEREWPDTIHIVIEERQAWGTWDQGGAQYMIDRDGVVLGLGAAPDGSPVIKSSEPGSRQQGDRVDYQAVDAAAEIYARLPQELGTQVTEVAFVAGKGVQVTTANGQSALLGDSSSIAYKLAVWAAVSKQADSQRMNYTTIDLRFGNRPVLQ